MLKLKATFKIIGVMLMMLGGLMCLPALVSWYYQSGDGLAILLSGLITLCGGGLLYFLCRGADMSSVQKREGYLIVTLSWMFMLCFGALPYLLSDSLLSLTDSFFEAVSGLTTTGATILTDIEAMPRGLLFWRSMSQWIGGMGIIVLTIAVLPLLGVGGIELFVAEATGSVSDKIHPRIKATASALWFIYLSLTLVCAFCYWLGGMSPFDAVNHSMTTLSTGGYSTRNASLAFYNSPLIEYTAIAFMFLGGVNFTIIYFLLVLKWKRIWHNDEFRGYLLIVGAIALLVFCLLFIHVPQPMDVSFRQAVFQVVSIVTTTGYVTADYTGWLDSITAIFFALLFTGACAGSTSGGIKLIRHVVFFKNSMQEFRRLLHPKAMIRIKLNGQIVPACILTHILVFLLIYMGIFLLCTIVLSGIGVDLVTAMGAVGASLGNVGPGIGSVGPMENYANLDDAVKWICMFLMLLGRLELFTVLIIFTPYFWRTN